MIACGLAVIDFVVIGAEALDKNKLEILTVDMNTFIMFDLIIYVLIPTSRSYELLVEKNLKASKFLRCI